MSPTIAHTAPLTKPLIYPLIVHPPSYPSVNPHPPTEPPTESSVCCALRAVVRDDLWRTVRSAWQPAMSPGSLALYHQLIVQCADKLVEHLAGGGPVLARSAPGGAGKQQGQGQGQGQEEGQVVDMYHLLTSMTLQVVGACAYG